MGESLEAIRSRREMEDQGTSGGVEVSWGTLSAPLGSLVALQASSSDSGAEHTNTCSCGAVGVDDGLIQPQKAHMYMMYCNDNSGEDLCTYMLMCSAVQQCTCRVCV